VFSTALVARLFQLCRPSLLSLAWFRRAFDWILATRLWLYARVEAMPAWQAMRMAVRRLKAKLRSWWPRLDQPS
jgi:hypothetical protein